MRESRRASSSAALTHSANEAKTIREIHELAQSGSGIDLLKDFSEVAREELGAFTFRTRPKRRRFVATIG